MGENQKIRESNFELLRIISMLMIFIYHYINYGGILEVGSYTNNKLIAIFLFSGGRLGVNIFIIIMGYFMINSKFKIKKYIKMVLQVFFYSSILAIIAVYRLKTDFEHIDIKAYLTPVISGVYWFTTYYLIVYLFTPYLNKFIKSLGKKGCEKLIIVGAIILSGIPTISYRVEFATNFFTWFVYMYIVGAYIKLYNFEFKNKKTARIITFLYPFVAYATIIISIIINKTFKLDIDIFHFIGLYSFIVLIGSFGTFMFFKNLKINSNKIINLFAKTSFAIYLFHEHILYRNILWTMDLKTQVYEQSPFFIFIGHILLSTFVVYLLISFIEIIRINLLEKPIFKIKVLNNCCEKFDNWYNSINIENEEKGKNEFIKIESKI